MFSTIGIAVLCFTVGAIYSLLKPRCPNCGNSKKLRTMGVLTSGTEYLCTKCDTLFKEK